MKHRRLVQTWVYMDENGYRRVVLCYRRDYQKTRTDVDLPDGVSMCDEKEPMDVVLEPDKDESEDIQELGDGELEVV